MDLVSKIWRIKNAFKQRFDKQEQDFAAVYPFIDKVEGFLKSPHQEKWFYKSARQAPDHAVIVEIGSFKGRSTVSFGYGCVGTEKHIYAIDLFEGDGKDYGQGEFQKIFQANVDQCGLTQYVTSIKMHSMEVAKTWDKEIDILFIDGSHEYEDVKADFHAFYPHVKKNGIIAFHDIKGKWDGVIQFWAEVKKANYLTEVGQVNSLGFGRKV